MVGRLSEATGRDLAHLLIGADAGTLRATRNAQLATFALSLVALDAVWGSSLGDLLASSIGAVAGHSLGEYAALAATEAIGAEEGAALVKARGDAMQAASEANPGTMAAVLGLDLSGVAAACEAAGEAWVANDNTPGQVVIAGALAGVERAGKEATARGAKRVVPLQVGGAFHTPLMAAAQAPLDSAIGRASFRSPRWPLVANFDAQPHHDGFGRLLSSQLCSRVLWRSSLLALSGMGARLFVELGPGTELSGMVKRTLPTAGRANVASPVDIESLRPLLAAL